MDKTFFPDASASPTPFNTYPKKGKDNYDSAMLAIADTIQGRAQKNARMWQIIALVSLSSFILSLCICFYAVTLPKTVPVIVTVDSDGSATYVGKVDKSYWGVSNIPERHKIFQIKKLISNMFTWSTDPAAQNLYIKTCEDICQGDAVNQLNGFVNANNPFDWMGFMTQTVSIEPPLKQTEMTYVVYFTVTSFQQGIETGQKKYSALVTLDSFEVTKETEESNPLGLYITSFDIKELN